MIIDLYRELSFLSEVVIQQIKQGMFYYKSEQNLFEPMLTYEPWNSAHNPAGINNLSET